MGLQKFSLDFLVAGSLFLRKILVEEIVLLVVWLHYVSPMSDYNATQIETRPNSQ